MTDTERLVAFLLARETECEAPDDLPHHSYCQAFQEADDGGCEFRGDLCDCGWPTRVLADCAAKRAIIELHARPNEWSDSVGPRQTCRTCGDTVTEDWPCPTLRALIRVHASHAEFDPTWDADPPPPWEVVPDIDQS